MCCLRRKERRIYRVLQKASKAAVHPHAPETGLQTLEGRWVWTNSTGRTRREEMMKGFHPVRSPSRPQTRIILRRVERLRTQAGQLSLGANPTAQYGD
jgi:hypothetical protein